MPGIRTERFAEPTSLLLGLGELRRRGLTPRGLLFLALDPTGGIHLAVPENLDDVAQLKVGDKLGLVWPVDGRFFHFDSVHRLRDGFFVFNGDRRLTQPVLPDPVAAPDAYFAAAFSFPKWLADRWLDRYGPDECTRLGFWFNSPPPLWIRVNKLHADRETYRLRLAVIELVTNSITHGYCEAGLCGTVELRAEIDDRELTLVIEDTAIPYDPTQTPAPDDLDAPVDERKIGGLGVYLALQDVDSFRYEHVGGRNRCTVGMKRPAV